MPEPAADLFRRGACILAAHTYLAARGEGGLKDGEKKDRRELDALAELGGRVIYAAVG